MDSMMHPDSKFTAFSLPLANGATLKGISYIPPRASNAPRHRPLLVLIHGGTCNTHHYDVDSKHTASIAASALSVPVVSISRPGYGGTTSLFPLPEGSSFNQETAKWEHEYIFPLLWKTYGEPNGCAGLVALGHSLATPSLVVAASLHAQDPQPAYPLAGLIASGWGTRWVPREPPSAGPMALEATVQWKYAMMLGEPELAAADASVRQYMPAQTELMPPEEIGEHHNGSFASYWKEDAARIEVPIMYGLAEHDWFWQGTMEHVREYESYFPKCPRFDGSVIKGAPHAIEWSHFASGWYARCFGFAQEVTAWKAIKDGSKST